MKSILNKLIITTMLITSLPSSALNAQENSSWAPYAWRAATLGFGALTAGLSYFTYKLWPSRIKLDKSVLIKKIKDIEDANNSNINFNNTTAQNLPELTPEEENILDQYLGKNVGKNFNKNVKHCNDKGILILPSDKTTSPAKAKNKQYQENLKPIFEAVNNAPETKKQYQKQVAKSLGLGLFTTAALAATIYAGYKGHIQK